MDAFLTPSVAGGFGSTPMMVLPRSSGADDGVRWFGSESTSAPKGLFALVKSRSEGWKVCSGWIYCGLQKVSVEEATLGSNPRAAYLNVTESGGKFSAEISSQAATDAIVSIVLYEFKDGKVSKDGRNVMFVPVYN